MHRVKGGYIVHFLRRLLHQIPGKLLIMWAGLPAYRSQVIKGFLAQAATERLHLQALPA
jgi:hypothetical protein